MAPTCSTCSILRHKFVRSVISSAMPLHSCDYFKKNSIKTNVATDEGNGRNET